jgi:hypothetical protein
MARLPPNGTRCASQICARLNVPGADSICIGYPTTPTAPYAPIEPYHPIPSVGQAVDTADEPANETIFYLFQRV